MSNTAYASFSDATTQISASTGTVAAITTVWLPLPTAYPSISGCATEIYKPGGGEIFDWDPLYRATISPAATGCLPREVSSSYNQGALSQTDRTTLLGPTFVCPAAYQPVATFVIDSYTKQTLCCPTSFTLGVALTTGGYPTQCISSITAGEVITYLTASGGAPASAWKTAIVTPGATRMLAIHVNGYNVVTDLSSSSSSSQITGSSSSSTTATSSSAGSISPSSSASKSGLSSGAAAGIGVGATAVVIFAALAAFLLYRRRKKAAGSPVPTEDPRTDYYGGNGNGKKAGAQGDYDTWRAHMQQAQSDSAHEMESSELMERAPNELPVQEVRHEMLS